MIYKPATIMKIQLEVTGGFTGPAGKQVMQVDTDHLAPTAAARLHHDLEQLPTNTWGQSYVSPKPQSWDFLHHLTVTDDGKEKSVQFHLNQGPPALTQIAQQMTEIQNASGDK